MSTITIKAYHVKQSLDLKRLKLITDLKPLIENSSELFYKLSEGRYLYMSNYGAVVFYNCDILEETSWLQKLFFPKGINKNDLLMDQFDVVEQEHVYIQVGFGHVALHHIDTGAIKIIMLNMAQSIALDYYDDRSQEMIGEVKYFTTEMEQTGRLKINNRSILKFIGKTLNTQNRIAENLYIFDSPAITWEDEYYNAIHLTLSKHFELNARYRSIDNNLKITEANLRAFMEVNNHRESSKLEWIIIILILVEVIDTFISKL